VERCHGQAKASRGFCDRHECIAEGCHNRGDVEGGFCAAVHQCGALVGSSPAVACHARALTDRGLCYLHECRADGCHELAAGADGGFCTAIHQCAREGCRHRASTDRGYCARRHGCFEPGCVRPRSNEDQLAPRCFEHGIRRLQRDGRQWARPQFGIDGCPYCFRQRCAGDCDRRAAAPAAAAPASHLHPEARGGWHGLHSRRPRSVDEGRGSPVRGGRPRSGSGATLGTGPHSASPTLPKRYSDFWERASNTSTGTSEEVWDD